MSGPNKSYDSIEHSDIMNMLYVLNPTTLRARTAGQTVKTIKQILKVVFSRPDVTALYFQCPSWASYEL